LKDAILTRPGESLIDRVRTERGSTTDLEVLRKYPHRFTWGHIIQIHVLKRYTIVEFVQPHPESELTRFHVYVDERDTNRGAETFESALLLAIAIGQLGPTGHADEMARAAQKLLTA
jgi:hypothetical protein